MPPLKKNMVRPLDNWDNPDLMLAETRREALAQEHPWAVKMFDWPELRKLFHEHDLQANFYRKVVRWQGRLAIGLAVAGLFLAALLPVLAVDNQILLRALGAIASFSAVFGGIIGFEHLFLGKAKRRWLCERFWTERLRQFYFQTILRNLEILTSDQLPFSSDDWKEIRASELHWFINDYMKNPDVALTDVEKDLLDEKAWLRSEPVFGIVKEVMGGRLPNILSFFQSQRLNIQEEYIREKISSDPFSPSKLAAATGLVANFLAGLVLLVAIFIGVQFWTNPDVSGKLLTWGLALEAIGCVLLAGVRVLDEGLRYTEETDLYSWYAAKVTKLHRRFTASSEQEKLAIILEMEQATYEEFRRFFIAHSRANFLL